MVALAALTAILAASAASASPVEKRQRSSPVFPGAVGFVNPGPRGFDGTQSRTGPCGGFARGGAENRTDFPLTGGDFALALSRDAYDITVSYATGADDSNFQPLIPALAHSFTGSKCFGAPDLSAIGASVGDVLTLQLTYVASAQNSTFYQCADINVVEAATYSRPEFTCANVTASTQTRSQGGNSSTAADAASSAAAPTSTGGSNGAGILNPVSWVTGAGAVALAALAL